MTETYSFTPIGYVRSPFKERADAPRQASADGGRGVRGTIKLVPGIGLEDAVSDLEGWQYLWVIFVFHANVKEGRGWKPKVTPPRSATKRGVLATRSPHRPNPIGLSVVELEAIDGLTLRVKHLDILDGTPVLDLKPYVPYADAYPDARTGWLDAPRDPDPGYAVTFSDRARAQLAWLAARGVDLEAKIAGALALGPQPHAYRRIRKHGDELVLALKEWRARFVVAGRDVRVIAIASGYREKQLATDPTLALHREFVAAFTAGT
jgi:tRNA-Thr(GGU) m(6)t(6)A37 methyltransferase TsaA